MNPILQRALLAYRPLYLHGLLMDGQYRLPSVPSDDGPTAGPDSHRASRRVLIVALVAAVGAVPALTKLEQGPSPQELP